MHSRIHHVSLTVRDFDWYVSFFEDVFAMEVERTKGEKPRRQIWFSQGIQINEAAEDRMFSEPAACDHISIGVDTEPAEAAAAAIARGCHKAEGKGAHWFILPNGVPMELKPLR